MDFDELNLNKERNSENTDIYEYNCGGYALGTYTWINIESYYRSFKTREEYNDILTACIEEIEDEFRGLVRTIDTLEELKDNEFAVLFRLGCEPREDEDGYSVTDFHFMKRMFNGTYFHKPGSRNIRQFLRNPFIGNWGETSITYNSDIIIFAVDNKLY